MISPRKEKMGLPKGNQQLAIDPQGFTFVEVMVSLVVFAAALC